MEVSRNVVDRLDRRSSAAPCDAAQNARPQAFPLNAVDREAAPLVVVAGFAVAITAGFARLLTQDGWLALVAGREIAQHGLPSHDHLTVWSNGRAWVDEQWLGQLAFYGAHAVGGVRL